MVRPDEEVRSATGEIAANRGLDAAMAAAADKHYGQYEDGPEGGTEDPGTETDTAGSAGEAETPEATGDRVPETTGDEETGSEESKEAEDAPVTSGDEDLDKEATKEAEEEEEVRPRAPDGTYVESFTKTNPADLPEDVKPFYKSMQADYTKKCMALREKEDELDAALAQVDELDDQFQTVDGLRDFVIQVYAKSPAAFQDAVEVIDRLQAEGPEGDRERELWNREQRVKQDERKNRIETTKREEAEKRRITRKAVTMIAEVELETGIPFDTIEEAVMARLTRIRDEKGVVTEDDIKREVDAFVEPVRQRMGPSKKQDKAKEQQKRVREKVEREKQQPKGKSVSGGSPPVSKEKEPEKRTIDDVIYGAIEQRDRK